MASTYFTVLPKEVLNALSSPRLTQGGRVAYLRLPHPRTGLPALFLPSESDINDSDAVPSQILEVQAVNPIEPRSWFLGNEVVADGKLLLMTPMDPVFLLLPILQCIQPENGLTGQFRPFDDISEEVASKMKQTFKASSPEDPCVRTDDILRFLNLRCTKIAFRLICDVKEITEEITVYRFSLDKSLQYCRKKVARLANPRILELSRTLIRGLAKDGLMEDGKEELLKSGQLRAACDLVSNYLPPNIRELLYASYDFTQLDIYMKSLADEAMALADITQNDTKSKNKAGNKAGGEGKKRKAAKGSHGVEALKKANVNGMAKLSTFFKKAEET